MMKKSLLLTFLLINAVFGGTAWGQEPYSYSCNFDEDNLAEEGWLMLNCVSGTGWESYEFYFKQSINPPQYLITPELNSEGGGFIVEFDYSHYNTISQTFKVGYSLSTLFDINSFVWDNEIISSSNGGHYNREFQVVSKVKYIAIAYTKETNVTGMSIDNFTVTGANKATYLAPKNVDKTELTNESVKLSWDGDAISYNVRYKQQNVDSYTTIENITNKYFKITGLEPECGYITGIQSVYDGGNSDWAEVSFTTEACADDDKCIISYSLYDDYGDGWNGAYIDVIDVNTNTIIETLSILDDESDEQSGSFNVCDGRIIRFKWYGKTYDECYFTISIGDNDFIKVEDPSEFEADLLEDYYFNKSDDSYIQVPIKIFTTSGEWDDTDNWQDSERPNGTDDVIINDNVTIPSNVIAQAATITLDGGSITIEDGGQLICSNSVAATVKKTITDPTKAEDYGHWYTISTPVHKDATDNVVISETNLTSMGASNYDMFYLDETQGTWINQKTSGTGFSNMYVGKGYLYRNNGTDLEITGNTNTGDVAYTLTKDGSGDIAGFNLIGNPYPHDINLKHITYGSGDNLVGFYRLSNAGAWGSELGETEPIHSYEGFLVQADVDDKVATFHETAQRGAKSNGDNIKFMVANSQYEDVAYALFDKGFGLSKINHRNADIPMLYINQEGADYAIATMSDDTKSFNLNFKAMTTGKYTLSYKADGNFSYLHVIDRLTGEDVDMLLEGEYSFIASPIDSENRFIVRLEYSAGSEISESSIFAYQSGNDIIVNGEGELQIFDMMGRRVSTQYVSGVETINLQLNGVYIFKLNEKTQKIVVK